MKQLTINPKEKGTTIKFGKLPIFIRSLTHWSDMDNVVQLKVEGRYYAIELRPRQLSDLEKALEKMKTAGVYSYSVTTEIPQDDEIARECKADVEEANEPIQETQEPVQKTQEQRTQEPVQKTQYEVGRERFEKLKELGRTGELAECRTRTDICRKMGLDAQRGTPGYNWVSNQIRKGYLSEELVKFDKQNTGEYRFRMTGTEPMYSGNKNIKEKTVEKKWEKLRNELEDLGFTNLSSTPNSTPTTTPTPIPKNREEPLKPFARGNLELAQWLKPQDYLIYRLFVYGNGQVSIGKAVTFDEVRDVFLELPDVKAKKTRGTSEKTAGRIANVALIQLIKKGVLAKEQPELVNKENIFSLTLTRGGQYARKVYYTVSRGMYREGKGRTRELCDQTD